MADTRIGYAVAYDAPQPLSELWKLLPSPDAPRWLMAWTAVDFRLEQLAGAEPPTLVAGESFRVFSEACELRGHSGQVQLALTEDERLHGLLANRVAAAACLYTVGADETMPLWGQSQDWGLVEVGIPRVLPVVCSLAPGAGLDLLARAYLDDEGLHRESRLVGAAVRQTY